MTDEELFASSACAETTKKAAVSVEFYLRNVSVRPPNLGQHLARWMDVSGVTGRRAEEDGFASIFMPGTSIRGFSLRRHRRVIANSVELRLSVAASEADWTSAYSFMRFMADRGFTVRSEDGARLHSNDLTADTARERWRKQFTGDLGALQQMMYSQGDEPVQLPNDHASVKVTRADIPEGPLTAELIGQVQAVLQARAARFSDSRLAATITLKNDPEQLCGQASLWSPP